MPANDNSAIVYQVVFNNPIAGLISERFSAAQLGPAMAEHGFTQVGVNTNPKHRVELQGQPKFDGLCGPMYGGPGVVRYETAAAYSQLSA